MKKLNRKIALILLYFLSCGISSYADTTTDKYQINFYGIKDVKITRQALAASDATEWIDVVVEKREFTIGKQVILRYNDAAEYDTNISALEKKFPDASINKFSALSNAYIIDTTNPIEALKLSSFICKQPNVKYVYPDYLDAIQTGGTYSSLPNDKYFGECWHLNNRDENGEKIGWDMNARMAWATTMGENCYIAVMDTGVQMSHPDLTDRMQNNLHYNITTDAIDPNPISNNAHGTGVAGLAAATAYNNIGMAGVAPMADIVGILTISDKYPINASKRATLYTDHCKNLQVINQSWYDTIQMNAMSPLERDALDLLISADSPSGSVVVRCAGNDRRKKDGFPHRDANDEPRSATPDTIVVGAVLPNGTYTDYSTPGANVLVGAPGGDTASANPLFMTDLTGTHGWNYINYFPPMEDYNNYATSKMNGGGTSFSTPLVAGACALIRSVNKNLTPRDVRHILVQSAKHHSNTDPDITTNFAGFKVNHTAGFGVPDLGHAVQLAKKWGNLPKRDKIEKQIEISGQDSVPPDGYVLEITGGEITVQIPITISDSIFPTGGVSSTEIVDLGCLTNSLPTGSLSGKGALIQRGLISFADKIKYAADADAQFVILYNNEQTDDLIYIGDVERSLIPSVFISGNSGLKIQSLLAKSPTTACLKTKTLTYSFHIEKNMICEDVFAHISANGENCGTMRIDLVSPSGTRSTIHRYNGSEITNFDWTFYDVHHFYEPTHGTWKIEITNMPLGNNPTGEVKPYMENFIRAMELKITGIPILDTDTDGLDDDWEIRHFNSLQHSAADIISPGGYNNARWQICGDEIVAETETMSLTIDPMEGNHIRVAWCSAQGTKYRLQKKGTTKDTDWTTLREIMGQFPYSEVIVSAEENGTLYRLETTE